VPAFLVALRDKLTARFAATAGFEAVGVYAAPAGDPPPLEMVEWFAVPSHTQAWAALGNRRRSESYTIDGVIACLVPGSGEPIADQARARAYAILAIVEDELRRHWDMDGLIVKSSQLTSATLHQDIAEEGRWAALRLTVSVETELTSS
jgi:hypothetical protein